MDLRAFLLFGLLLFTSLAEAQERRVVFAVVGDEKVTRTDLAAFARQQEMIFRSNQPEGDWNEGREIASALQLVLREGRRRYYDWLAKTMITEEVSVSKAVAALEEEGLTIGFDRVQAMRNKALKRALSQLPAKGKRSTDRLDEIHQQFIVPVPILRGYAKREWLALATTYDATTPSLTLPSSEEEFSLVNRELARKELAQQLAGRDLLQHSDKAPAILKKVENFVGEKGLNWDEEDVRRAAMGMLEHDYQLRWMRENIAITDLELNRLLQQYLDSQLNHHSTAKSSETLKKRALPLLDSLKIDGKRRLPSLDS